MQTSTRNELKALTEEVQELEGQLCAVHEQVEREVDRLLEYAWRLGGLLLRVRAVVGHGHWGAWVQGNMRMQLRQVQRYVQLARSNPGATSVAELSAESVRRFRQLLTPGGEDQGEAGEDVALPPAWHHMTLANQWRRLHRRVEAGHVALDVEQARRDLEPMWRWLCGLYGVTGEQMGQAYPPGRESSMQIPVSASGSPPALSHEPIQNPN